MSCKVKHKEYDVVTYHPAFKCQKDNEYFTDGKDQIDRSFYRKLGHFHLRPKMGIAQEQQCATLSR